MRWSSVVRFTWALPFWGSRGGSLAVGSLINGSSAHDGMHCSTDFDCFSCFTARILEHVSLRWTSWTTHLSFVLAGSRDQIYSHRYRSWNPSRKCWPRPRFAAHNQLPSTFFTRHPATGATQAPDRYGTHSHECTTHESMIQP